MTKYEFLGDLSRLLSDLPEEERKQALHYYEDYFADAGEDKEQSVLEELGTPADIARQIKEDNLETISYGDSTHSKITDSLQPYDLGSQKQDSKESRDQSYYEQQSKKQQYSRQDGWTKAGPEGQDMNFTRGNDFNNKNSEPFWKNMDKTTFIFMIVVLILTSPVWGSVAIGMISMLIGIVSAILGILLAMILGGGGSAIGGIVVIIGGIVALAAGEAGAGLLTLGIGCFLLSLGAAFCYLGIFLCIKLFPALWKQLQRFYNWCRLKWRLS